MTTARKYVPVHVYRYNSITPCTYLVLLVHVLQYVRVLHNVDVVYCNINTLDTRRCCGAARCKLHPAGGRQTARSACLQNKKISRRWTTDRTHRCTVCYRQCFLRWRSLAVVATTIYFVLACFAREGLPSASSCPAATAARPPAGGSDGLSWSKVP